MSGQWERTWLAGLFLHASPWASAITLTLMLLRDLCLPGLLPPPCGLHPSCCAASCTSRFWQRKKDIQLQKRPFHRFCSKLVPKVAHIDSTPDLTQITLYTEPMLSRASSQANWISSPRAHPSDMDLCSHGRAVPQHSWDVSQ